MALRKAPTIATESLLSHKREAIGSALKIERQIKCENRLRAAQVREHFSS